MSLTPYRQTLALPGIRALMAVATLARIPVTAATVTLTLYVVTDLGRGYGAAGLAGAAFTVGAALGAPVLGRVVDRRGLRPVLVLTTVVEATFWASAQSLPYTALVVAALIGGFLTLPAAAAVQPTPAQPAPTDHRLAPTGEPAPFQATPRASPTATPVSAAAGANADRPRS